MGIYPQGIIVPKNKTVINRSGILVTNAMCVRSKRRKSNMVKKLAERTPDRTTLDEKAGAAALYMYVLARKCAHQILQKRFRISARMSKNLLTKM